MRITDFEKNFLGIDGGNDEFNPYVTSVRDNELYLKAL